MNVVEERSLRRWAYVLLAITWLCIAWLVWDLVKAALGIDFQLGFFTKDGIQSFSGEDFSLDQRLVLVAIASVPTFCWLYSLWQIMRMAIGFSRGEILTQRAVGYLEHFGWGMVGLAVSDTLLLVAIGEYLVTIGKIPSFEDHWKYMLESGFQINLMAALLIMIISRILRIGIRLREDAELTI